MKIKRKEGLLFIKMFIAAVLSAVIMLVFLVGIDNLPEYLPAAVYVGIVVAGFLSVLYYMTHVRKR